MAILGLTSTEDFSTERFKNVRRQVFYFYPNGAAPLVGLLSMMTDEVTNDPEFYWYEKRLSNQSTTTAQANSAGPFTATGTDTDLTAGGWSAAVGDVIRVRVPSGGTNILRVGHVVQIKNVPLAGGGTIDIQGRVDSKVTGVTTKFEIQVTAAITSALNNTTANGLEIWVIGSAFGEGAVGSSGDIWNLPVTTSNYTEIYRTEFRMTGTALKTGAKFDETGPYADKAKENSVYHMIEMEKSFIFSRAKVLTTQADGMPRRLTKGILGFLTDWEGGTVYGNTAATLDTDDNKRIITNSGGTINLKTWESYVERAFRVTNNAANEKLFLCGSGFLMVMNQLFADVAGYTPLGPEKDTFGMSLTKYMSPFGTIYFKTHPLFSQNARERYNGLLVDVNNLRYRYMDGRDTDLLKNRQPNDADYRKDEWLSECGLELRFPESFLYLQNVRDFIP